MTTDRELDQLAADYYLDPPADLWLEERVQAWILPWLARQCPGKTLEMGWGTGIVARTLRAAGVDLQVVEGSARLATQARRLLPGRIHQSLFEGYDPGPVFETGLCLHVLEHVENPVLMLERIRGWLRPGGRLIVVTPNATSIHRKVGSLMSGDLVDTLSDRDRLVGHRRVYTLQQLAQEVEAAAFSVEHVAGWYLKVVPNSLSIDWAPELIDALCQLGWEGPPEDAANIIVIARA